MKGFFGDFGFNSVDMLPFEVEHAFDYGVVYYLMHHCWETLSPSQKEQAVARLSALECPKNWNLRLFDFDKAKGRGSKNTMTMYRRILTASIHIFRDILNAQLYSLVVKVFKFRIRLCSSNQSMNNWQILQHEALELVSLLFKVDAQLWDKSITHALVEMVYRDGPIW